ncbi:SUF system NifU family Fe-S cluster assembly protein [Candidatus Acetothermia bacterium]|jgi:nitrogen fixation NifU-like protein|nr:SUF system NifU family Fe-S cluster assembly protein [Candidatus Acetothermia bacterium]MCI2431027.1 SUF system NifU family Fe-S cluster assembly protein [Candidatus Acetothermia bacterium]MCI2436923.1 SUF system NifU family Fe-S cluster assembly protein [Candidatus Acetothermia bacterium]
MAVAADLDFIIEHYKNPQNYGHLENPDIVHEEGNPSCGDQIRIELKIDNDRITDVRFSGKGCAISQAAASILTEEIKGKTLAEVKEFDKQKMLDLLGVEISAMRMKCALLALKIVKAGAYGITEWPGEEE